MLQPGGTLPIPNRIFSLRSAAFREPEPANVRKILSGFPRTGRSLLGERKWSNLWDDPGSYRRCGRPPPVVLRLRIAFYILGTHRLPSRMDCFGQYRPNARYDLPAGVL